MFLDFLVILIHGTRDKIMAVRKTTQELGLEAWIHAEQVMQDKHLTIGMRSGTDANGCLLYTSPSPRDRG